jgi:hypothetical protein
LHQGVNFIINLGSQTEEYIPIQLQDVNRGSEAAKFAGVGNRSPMSGLLVGKVVNFIELVFGIRVDKNHQAKQNARHHGIQKIVEEVDQHYNPYSAVFETTQRPPRLVQIVHQEVAPSVEYQTSKEEAGKEIDQRVGPEEKDCVEESRHDARELVVNVANNAVVEKSKLHLGISGYTHHKGKSHIDLARDLKLSIIVNRVL